MRSLRRHLQKMQQRAREQAQSVEISTDEIKQSPLKEKKTMESMPRDKKRGRQQGPFLVAVDDGYAQMKLVGENPSGAGLIEICFRSSARSGHSKLVALNGDVSVGAYQTDDGEFFTVSDSLKSEDTTFDSFHFSPMNRVLVNHALVVAGYGGKDVNVIAGLPVEDFFVAGAGVRADDRIGDKRQNLLKKVTNVGNAANIPNIASVRVGCQAVAAFIDYFVDDDLNERDVPIEQIAIVDIGGRTTDIAVIYNGSQFDSAGSGTENIGVLDVYRALELEIQKKFGIRDRFSLAALDSAVRDKQITIWGEAQPIQELVSATIKESENQIARVVERRLGSASSFNKIIFVGGGASLFSDISSRFRNGFIPVNPEFANARGLFKFCKKFPE